MLWERHDTISRTHLTLCKTCLRTSNGWGRSRRVQEETALFRTTVGILCAKTRDLQRDLPLRMPSWFASHAHDHSKRPLFLFGTILLTRTWGGLALTTTIGKWETAQRVDGGQVDERMGVRMCARTSSAAAQPPSLFAPARKQ